MLQNYHLFFLQAIENDPEFPKKIGQIVILGGAFFVNGNVNPAAEANVCCCNPDNIASSIGLPLRFMLSCKIKLILILHPKSKLLEIIPYETSWPVR